MSRLNRHQKRKIRNSVFDWKKKHSRAIFKQKEVVIK